jgi:hypothetical protein
LRDVLEADNRGRKLQRAIEVRVNRLGVSGVACGKDEAA